MHCSAGGELHALGDDVLASVFDQKMHMVRCDDVIEHAQTEPLLRLEKPLR